MTLDELRNLLENLIDPSLGKTLKETDGIKHLGYDDKKDVIVLIVAMGKLGDIEEKSLRRRIARLVKIDCGYTGLKLQMEEIKVLNSIARSKIKFIGIISGKGGVGKSTVTGNIANRLAKKGHHVGVIDADIYGSSMPTVLNFEHKNPHYDDEGKIIPLKKDNIELISTEFFTSPSEPVIWRGAMLNSMISHFFYDVKWHDKTEYVIIDFPPGTGDITMDIKNIVPQTKMLLVTTPHPSACHVAVKSGHAATKLGHEIIGIIENMSYYVNPINSQREYIFGQGGGRKIAEQLNTELIAQIPIGQSKSNTDLFEITETQGKIYDEIADFIILNTMDK